MLGPSVAIPMMLFSIAAVDTPTGQKEVSSERWIELGSDNEGADHLDLGTVERVGNVRRAWLRTTYTAPRDDGATTVFYQFEMDCATRTHQLVAYARQRDDGSHIDSGTILESERQTDPIIPGSTAELEFELLCQ